MAPAFFASSAARFSASRLAGSWLMLTRATARNFLESEVQTSRTSATAVSGGRLTVPGNAVAELRHAERHRRRDQGVQARALELDCRAPRHLDRDDGVRCDRQVRAVRLGVADRQQRDRAVLEASLHLGPAHLGHQHVLGHWPRRTGVSFCSFPRSLDSRVFWEGWSIRLVFILDRCRACQRPAPERGAGRRPAWCRSGGPGSMATRLTSPTQTAWSPSSWKERTRHSRWAIAPGTSGSPWLALQEGEALELGRAELREAPRDVLLALCSTLIANSPLSRTPGVGLRAVVDAHEHERRIEAHRAEGAHREAERAGRRRRAWSPPSRRSRTGRARAGTRTASTLTGGRSTRRAPAAARPARPAATSRSAMRAADERLEQHERHELALVADHHQPGVEERRRGRAARRRAPRSPGTARRPPPAAARRSRGSRAPRARPTAAPRARAAPSRARDHVHEQQRRRAGARGGPSVSSDGAPLRDRLARQRGRPPRRTGR